MKILIGMGFKKSKYEACIFLKYSNDIKVIVPLCVDDFFIFC